MSADFSPVGGVDVEVAEEDLRVAGGRGSVLRIVVGLDVDGRGHGCLQAGEGCGLAVGAVHAVALGLGSQDHELEVRHRVRNAVQGEGHRTGAEGDGCSCGSSDAGKGRRRGHDAAASGHDPEVQAAEEFRAGDLGLGAKDRAALCIPWRDCARPGGCAFPGRSPRGPCNLVIHSCWPCGPSGCFRSASLREQALDGVVTKTAGRFATSCVSIGCGE